VQRIKEIVAELEERLRKMPSVPTFSYGSGQVRKGGAPNRNILKQLFGHKDLAIQYLTDVGLVRSNVRCNVCEGDMTWCAAPDKLDGFIWRCQRRIVGGRCRGTVSIKQGSCLQLSNLIVGNYASYV
jgi:hypothetical protein